MKISMIKRWYSPTDFYFEIKREVGEYFYPTIDIHRGDSAISGRYYPPRKEGDIEFTERAIKKFEEVVENHRKMSSLKPETIKEVEI